jgi:hypothetical protein
MSAETDELEFDLTRVRCEREGFYLGRHKNFDPTLGGGDLYVMPTRKFRDQRNPSLLSYATSDEVHHFLNERIITKKNEAVCASVRPSGRQSLKS